MNARGLCCLSFAAGLVVSSWSSAQSFTQWVAFGDSLSDTGNVSNATFGISPGGNYFNGRFSNGVLWHEVMAGSLGLSAATPSRTGGRNYAHGGVVTGSGNTNILFFSFPNVGTQINQYLSGNTPNTNQIFSVWGGGNDFIDDLAQNPTTVVNNLVAHATLLNNAGARHIIVPNLPLLGETPRYRTTPDRAAYNALTTQFNTQLASALITLDQQLPANIYRLDVAGTLNQILANPSAFGLSNVTQPALSSGTVVPNPDSYLFYDDIHPTRVGHRFLATAAFNLVTAHDWLGGVGEFGVASNWSPAGTPDSTWIARVGNTAGSFSRADVTANTIVRQLLLSGAVGLGGVSVESGQRLDVNEFIQIDSGGFLNCGLPQAAVNSPAIQVMSGGQLNGGREIAAAVTNAGRLSPDAGFGPLGTAQITGSFTQTTSGSIRIDVDTAIPAADRLEVLGAASLAGTIQVDSVGTPVPGTSFPIISYASATGSLQFVNDTGFAGLRLSQTVTATGITLHLGAFPGDADLDAIVNIADFSRLAGSFNQAGNWLNGDFNFSSIVEIGDFALLAANFNQSAPPRPVGVPEPSIAVGLLTIAIGVRRSRRRARCD